MDNLLVSGIGFVFLISTIFISRSIGKDISFFRKMSKYFAYLIFTFLIFFGIINFFLKSSNMVIINNDNIDYIIDFPMNPKKYIIDDVTYGLKTKVYDIEYDLVVKEIFEDKSIVTISERFNKKLSDNNIQIIHSEINDIDCYYILYFKEYYSFKKIVLNNGILLDFTIKSTNQFPDEIEKRFLNYQIQ